MNTSTKKNKRDRKTALLRRRSAFYLHGFERLEDRMMFAMDTVETLPISEWGRDGLSNQSFGLMESPVQIAANTDNASLAPQELLDEVHQDEHGVGHYIDALGNDLYVDPMAPPDLDGSGSSPGPELAPLADTFKLHSRPGANHTIYLDFDGHTTTGTTWNSANSLPTIVSPAYDPGGNGASFTNAELTSIQAIWKRVAVDYATFQVDVTTEDPGVAALAKTSASDTKWGVRTVVTVDWNNCSCGGFAYVGSFNDAVDTPVFVFNTGQIGVSAASSHEVGHALGLQHDGTTAGAAYYDGHGTGDTGWGPIMGSGYYKNVTTFDTGQYFQANNQQNDWQVITTNNGFGYRPDTIGSTRTTALAVDNLGASSTDPTLTKVGGFGNIEADTDKDWFSFETATGNVNLTIDSYVQEVFTSTSTGFSRAVESTPVSDQGSNLDILATIYNSDLSIVATSNPATTLNASFANLLLPAGKYYLEIDGTGVGNWATNPPTGFNQSVSRGQYSITGTIPTPVPDKPLSKFQLASTPGTMAYSASQSGSISTTTETDTFDVTLEPNQTLSVAVKAVLLLQPSVRVTDANNVQIGSATAAAGQTAYLQNLPINAGGVYHVLINSVSATTGSYSTELLLNSAIEDESLANQSIDGSAVSQRLAVKGVSSTTELTPAFVKSNNPSAFVDISTTGTVLTLADDTSTTVLSNVGNSYFPAGQISISNNGGIQFGTGLTLDATNVALPTSIGNALLPYWSDVDATAGNVYVQELSIAGVPTLVVQWDNRPQYPNIGNGTFQLQLFQSGPLVARFAYKDVEFGDARFNQGAGATIGYQSDNSSAIQFSFDAVSVINGDVLDLTRRFSTDIDNYSVNLSSQVGKPIDIVVSGLSGVSLSQQSLKLLDASQNVIATAVPNSLNTTTGGNFDLGILGFVVPNIGTNVYTLRLESVASTYSIALVKSMSVEVESNNLPSSSSLRTLRPLETGLGFLTATVSGTAEPDPSAANAVLDEAFPGVRLSNSVTSASIYAVSSAGSPTGTKMFGSAANNVAGFNDQSNGFKATFDLPVKTVSIMAGSDDSSDVTRLSAFDINGALLETVTSNVLTTGQTQKLQFNRSKADIAYVTAGGLDTDGSLLDALQFNNAGDNTDYYALPLTAGQRIVLETGLPLATTAASLNKLNPELALYGTDQQTLLASDADSRDGRNARIAFTAPSTGTYFLLAKATSGSGEVTVNVLSPAPLVQNVRISGGAAQRSQVTSVTVTFDSLVDRAQLAQAFVLTNIDTNTQVTSLLVAAVDLNGQTRVDLTFGSGASVVNRQGTGLNGNSLANGNYRLDILSNFVRSTGGLNMSQDFIFGGQNAAAPNNDKFFRLLGDANGDGVLNGIDLNAIIPALFNPVGYREDLDTNGDGVINGIDLNALIPTLFGQGRR